MLPVALDWGDKFIREWYAEMYGLTGWEEMVRPLSEFMIGPVGTDKLLRPIRTTSSVKFIRRGKVFVKEIFNGHG